MIDIKEKALQYFRRTTFANVCEVECYVGHIDNDPFDGVIGKNEGGKTVAWVTHEDLEVWSNFNIINDREDLIAKNIMDHGWSPRWPSDEAKHNGPIGRNTQPGNGLPPWQRVGPQDTPLLIVSYSFALSPEQSASIMEKLKYVLRRTSWIPLVIDSQTEGKVQAFGVNPPSLDTLTIDEVIEMLEGLKRVREATQGGIPVANT